MQRAELHFHLLPDVDDGPVGMDEAVALARLAVADGTGIVTVTPHVRELLARGLLDAVAERVEELRAALAAARVPLAVLTGAELAHDDLPELDDARLDALAQGPPSARWVLIEAPLEGGAPEFLAATAELRARGLGTLIGHPERCPDLTPGAIERERAAGARLQVNASSLTGYHGSRARARGLELVRSGRADVLASDAHRIRRPPRLSAALAELGSGYEALASVNPRAFLAHGLGAAAAAFAA